MAEPRVLRWNSSRYRGGGGGGWGDPGRWGEATGLLAAAGKPRAFPFQLENGGDMAHLKDLTTQAMRFGLLFDQVLRTGLKQGEEAHPTFGQGPL